MTYPTDALLHGAQPEQDTAEGGGPGTVFDWSKGETATPEIVVNAAEVSGIRVAGLHIATGAFELTPRQPIYDEKDVTRQNPKRELEAEEVHQIISIKEVGQELIDLIDTLPLNRELAVAKTKAEEAVMWAVTGVTK